MYTRSRRSWLLTTLFITAFVVLGFAVLWPSPTVADDDIIELGGDDTSQRKCPVLTVAPKAFFQEYMDAASVVGASHVPYFSCRKECKEWEGANKKALSPKLQQFQHRNVRLWTVIPRHATQIFYGKAPPAAFNMLAQELKKAGQPAEWSTLAGIDCNGFVSNFAARNGWAWAHANLDPPSYAANPHIQSTRDICPGDIIVYKGARHVALVGKRLDQKVIQQNGKDIQLATFEVYESAADGTPQGLQVNVQGFDVTGKEPFNLYHFNQPSRTRSNSVYVVPGPGKL